jgi:hypothetical protein
MREQQALISQNKAKREQIKQAVSLLAPVRGRSQAVARELICCTSTRPVTAPPLARGAVSEETRDDRLATVKAKLANAGLRVANWQDRG